jgi:hypothetical protein
MKISFNKKLKDIIKNKYVFYGVLAVMFAIFVYAIIIMLDVIKNNFITILILVFVFYIILTNKDYYFKK